MWHRSSKVQIKMSVCFQCTDPDIGPQMSVQNKTVGNRSMNLVQKFGLET